MARSPTRSRAVRPGGRVVLVGIPSDDRTTFAAGLARRKGISMLLCRRMQPADLPRAIALAAAGPIDLTRLISERFPIEEASQAFAALAARRGLKVVVTPSLDWPRSARDGWRGLHHRCRLRDRVCARAPRRRRRRTRSSRPQSIPIAAASSTNDCRRLTRHVVAASRIGRSRTPTTTWTHYVSRSAACSWTRAWIGRSVIGIGVDFTACTMLPTTADGTPLCAARPISGATRTHG